MLKLIENEINKTDLMEVIEYELNYREQAHKAELQKIINEKNNENARLKAKLKENGIEF